MTQQSLSQTFTRPWGFYRVLWHDQTCQIKTIQINPGQRLSLQKHFRHYECWTVVSGKGKVTVADRSYEVKTADQIRVDLETLHRMECISSEPLVFVEVQLGEYFGEDDIQRFSDDYGRA